MPYVPLGNEREISALLGKVLRGIIVEDDDSAVVFETMEGERFLMYHEQDCCEDVHLNDTAGDFNDLLGSPITVAEVEVNHEPDPEAESESATWTFYKLATVKGSVTLRWVGRSNGYYSERVTFGLATDE